VSSKSIIIWAVGIAVVFGFLWWQGHIRRLAAYWAEMMEELRKCSWPTWIELRGSTLVIVITIVLLGGLTYVADLLFTAFFQKFIYTI
jgi:preprotein translocase subunit SecE